MKKTITYLFVVVFLFFIFFGSVLPVNGFESKNLTIFVGGSGQGNYSFIQQAIDVASDGDVVFVYPGIYYENVIVNRSILLKGQDKQTTIIDGRGFGDVVDIRADNCMVSGFTIRNSGIVFPFAGITVNADNNNIVGNIFFQNYYGIYLELTKGNTISDNHIFNNLQCGIYFSRASNNILSFNVVSNHSFNGFGLYEFSNNNKIVDNVFTNNSFSGVNIRESYGNYVEKNYFISNVVGLHQPTADSRTVVLLNNFSNNGIDVEIEKNPFMTIGSAYGLFILFVFFVFKKWVM
jgi:parallel beta-helix repeat protein